jgi:hypothetical protein
MCTPCTTHYIHYTLQVTADHGPAVSGAHNTIVATRAGKDLVSALCSGLLTIGPRFGGALDKVSLTLCVRTCIRDGTSVTNDLLMLCLLNCSSSSSASGSMVLAQVSSLAV